MNEIYIEQISTVRAIRFEEEYLDKYYVPDGYYVPRQALKSDKEKLPNLDRFQH